MIEPRPPSSPIATIRATASVRGQAIEESGHDTDVMGTPTKDPRRPKLSIEYHWSRAFRHGPDPALVRSHRAPVAVLADFVIG